MDAIWLILDSLSYEATPFASNGPNTMPEFERLVDSHGIYFSNAYAPGPFSPSSHASFFTGELPSTTGMYEAHPRYDSDLPTIGHVMSETHQTHLISTNMFLFQGLDRGFDSTNDLSRQYMLFRDASDPKNYSAMYNDDPAWKRYLDFLLDGGKPLRSLLNGISYKLIDDRIAPKRWGDEENFQYVGSMNDEIRRRLNQGPEDSFVVANYMDLHSPFDLSPAAIDRFFPDTPADELPLGIAAERAKAEAEKSYEPELMRQLYEAAIWDFDRKFAPLVADLIADDVFVAVFADHGPYDTNTAYADERLHVPLIIFDPNEEAREVPHTVNLRSLPKTTADAVGNTDNKLSGRSLLTVTESEPSITEVIHQPNEVYEKTGRVYVNRPNQGADREEIQHDIVLFEDDAKVTFIDGEKSIVRGEAEVTDELVEIGQDILADGPTVHQTSGEEVTEVTEQRLKRLGYIDE